MGYISLTTDFGTRDGNVGVMKGVIWGIAPEAKIADITHGIDPQNIHQAAYILGRHVFYFPENTIHVAVIDPGVGTTRRPIAAQIGPQRVVGPDNGVFSALYERAEYAGWPVKIIHTDKPQYWLPKVSDIFHGRDIFSTVAAHWAAGVPLDELGTEIKDPVRFALPRPRRTEKGWVGEVIHIDRFGNVASNIHRDDLADMGQVAVTINGITIDGLVRTFGERQPGDLIALYTSTDYLMISVVNGNGAARVDGQVGQVIEVLPRN